MTLAFVFVNCAANQSTDVAKAVRNVQGVIEASLTTGIYDLVLKIQADNEIKLEEVIRNMKSISGVTSTMTSIIYKAVHDSSGGAPPGSSTRES